MNKIIHGVVLSFFGMACWMVSGILKLPLMTGGKDSLPAFTRFCLALGPGLLIGLAILATVYCLRVWLRKTDTGHSWVAFLAVTVGALGFVLLPTLVAVYLPLVALLNSLTRHGP